MLPCELLAVTREKTNLSCTPRIVKEPAGDFPKFFSLGLQTFNLIADGAGFLAAIPHAFNFDRVAVTLPGPVASRLCPDLAEWETKAWNEIEYQGIVCVSLLLKRPLKGYYVTNITDPVPITAVIEMTTIVDKQELGGHDLVYLPKYVHRDDPIFERTDQDIEEEFLSTIENMYPEFSRDDVVAFRISRVRNVMALPTLRYSEKLPPMQTSIPGVFAVTSSHIVKGNLNVNETIDLAEEGLRDVLMKHINVRPK